MDGRTRPSSSHLHLLPFTTPTLPWSSASRAPPIRRLRRHRRRHDPPLLILPLQPLLTLLLRPLGLVELPGDDEVERGLDDGTRLGEGEEGEDLLALRKEEKGMGEEKRERDR